MPCAGCFTSGKKACYPLYRAGWAPVPVWMGVENLAPTVIKFPDHPAISKLLCLKNLNHIIQILVFYRLHWAFTYSSNGLIMIYVISANQHFVCNVILLLLLLFFFTRISAGQSIWCNSKLLSPPLSRSSQQVSSPIFSSTTRGSSFSPHELPTLYGNSVCHPPHKLSVVFSLFPHC